MYVLALKMLLNDRLKFHALIFAVACSAFLVSQQVSIFTGLMDRTTSQIKDVAQAPIWVMHPSVTYVDELQAMENRELARVRSVAQVEWAVPLFKGFTRITAPTGRFRQAILMGFDDATRLGAPGRIVLGSAADLARPDAVIIDDQGYRSLFPGQPPRLGDTLELNDRRGVIVAIARASPPFATFPLIYTRYSSALNFVGRERKTMTFILASPRPGVSVPEACAAVERDTGLEALPAGRFKRDTIAFYVANTGIPVNFGITVVTAIIVGIVVTGQTFFLFVFENIKTFAALKAIGLGDARLARLILAQALVVGVLGLGLGIGLSAAFFEATREIPKLRNFVLHPEIAAGTALLMLAITMLACIAAQRRVRRVEPAAVFRG